MLEPWVRNTCVDGIWSTTFRGAVWIAGRRASYPFGRLSVNTQCVCLEARRRFFPMKTCVQREDVDRIEVRMEPTFSVGHTIQIRRQIERPRSRLGFDGPTNHVVAALVWYGWPVVKRSWWFEEFKPV